MQPALPPPPPPLPAGMVEEVLPRSSQLAEPAVANVNHVLLVFSAALPAFQPSPATRYLLSAEAAWLPVTVAINKADLVEERQLEAVVQQVTGGREGGMQAMQLAGASACVLPCISLPPAASGALVTTVLPAPFHIPSRPCCRSPAGATALCPSAWSAARGWTS